jgi:hypothetical protein
LRGETSSKQDMAFSNYRSGPGERTDISAEAGLRTDGPFSNEVEVAAVPCRATRQGIETPYSRVVEEGSGAISTASCLREARAPIATPNGACLCNDRLTRARIATPADGGGCGTSQTERQQ